jgi:hypothetical protein
MTWTFFMFAASYMFKVAEECKASMIIVAAHNKVSAVLACPICAVVIAIQYTRHESPGQGMCAIMACIQYPTH